MADLEFIARDAPRISGISRTAASLRAASLEIGNGSLRRRRPALRAGSIEPVGGLVDDAQVSSRSRIFESGPQVKRPWLPSTTPT